MKYPEQCGLGARIYYGINSCKILRSCHYKQFLSDLIDDGGNEEVFKRK